MRTVGDIFIDALASMRGGMAPIQIATRLVNEGHANDLQEIIEFGGADLFRLHFKATGEVIRFDGEDWHYIRPPGQGWASYPAAINETRRLHRTSVNSD